MKMKIQIQIVTLFLVSAVSWCSLFLVYWVSAWALGGFFSIYSETLGTFKHYTMQKLKKDPPPLITICCENL